MATVCTAEQLVFEGFGRREVVGRFDRGRITSDACVTLLREVDRHMGLLDRLAHCFVDHRNADAIEHPVRTLVAQRVLGLALGYEDLNDHDQLRLDTLLAIACGQPDILGKRRTRRRDHRDVGCALDRYKRIAAEPETMDRLFVDVFVEAHGRAPEEVWLDLDATDDPLHGAQ